MPNDIVIVIKVPTRGLQHEQAKMYLNGLSDKLDNDRTYIIPNDTIDAYQISFVNLTTMQVVTI